MIFLVFYFIELLTKYFGIEGFSPERDKKETIVSSVTISLLYAMMAEIKGLTF